MIIENNIADLNFSIILIDDECLLCNRLAALIARRDSADLFRIAGLKSQAGTALLSKFPKLKPDLDSIYVIHPGGLYAEADAITYIAGKLGNYKLLLFIMKILPDKFNNWCYRKFAVQRYRIFGKSRYCSMDPELRKKFII